MIRKILSKIYHVFLRDPYRRLKLKKKEKQIRHHVYDVREILLQEHDLSGFNRYDVIVRLLAIENYYGLNDFGFELYAKQQRARGTIGWEGAVNRFKELIASYEKNGYDSSSEIQLDKNLKIFDGSHRIAMAFYTHHYAIACQVLPRVYETSYGLDWYVANDFEPKEVELIQKRYLQLVQEELRVLFIATLWGPGTNHYEEMYQQLSLLIKSYGGAVVSSDVTAFKSGVCGGGYDSVVRKVYAVDDIPSYRIEQKLQYMKGCESKICWVKFTLPAPLWRLKDNGNTLSRTCEKIKKAIRDNYRNKLSCEYYHDIIIHIGDNFYQNEYIEKLTHFRELNVSKILMAINNKSYQYVLIKTEVPYMPLDFPNSYAIGKDLDIICTKRDFNSIVHTIINEIQQMGLPYERVIIKDVDRVKIRLECAMQLIFQFDIATQTNIIDSQMAEEMIANREWIKDSYYIPPVAYELIVRKKEYELCQDKYWHKDYIETHIDDIDVLLNNRYC